MSASLNRSRNWDHASTYAQARAAAVAKGIKVQRPVVWGRKVKKQ